MLAELLAATPSPAPTQGHSTYDWFSDIVLPTAVGAGSLVVATLAVLVAKRSNRLSAASTKAAERSNALARRAIALDEQRNVEDRRRDLAAEREEFAARVTFVLDAYVHAVETNDQDEAFRANDAIAVLETERSTRGFLDVPLLNGVSWASEVNTRIMRAERARVPVDRGELFSVVRRTYEPALAAWAQNPDTCHLMINTVDHLLHRRLDQDLGPWK